VTAGNESYFDELVALGKRNQQIVELARRHCLNLEFREFGGRGAAEAATGLPINMRRVHCPFGRPSGSASMQLEWVALEFYDENCVGCPHRRPTGEVPNLASLVEDRNAAAREAEARARQETAAQRTRWRSRQEHRQAMASGADPAMVQAMTDIGTVDRDPLVEPDTAAAESAVRRLEALADRAPELFTDEVVTHLGDLLREQGATGLMSPLRRLASGAPQHREAVLGLAVYLLASSPLAEAGRCLVDLRDYLTTDRLDEQVVEALIVLAGDPERDRLGFRRVASGRTDPAGLRVAADLAPEVVTAVLRRLLRTPMRQSALILPPGTRTAAPRDAANDAERCAAAGALRSLASTHPTIAGGLVGSLVANLALDDEDDHGLYPVADVQHTLAALLVTGNGSVLGALTAAVPGAGPETRERLFGVLQRANRLLDLQDRWRDPEDPHLDEAGRRRCHRLLVGASLGRLDEDWGAEVALHAADLVKDLAADQPAWMTGDIPAVIGAFLLIAGRMTQEPAPSPLTVADAAPPNLAAMQTYARKSGRSAAAGRLLDAIASIATADLPAVLTALTDVLTAARTDGTEDEVAWRILPLLGTLGRIYGAEPSVLRTVLPRLYTYLFHIDVQLRARAIDAWTAIAAEHRVPSSLHDLLPALIQDRQVPVVRAVLRAARRLTWDSKDRRSLLGYAIQAAEGAPDVETLKKALLTILALAREEPLPRANIELYVLRKAGSLDGYDLKELLGYHWETASAHAPEMAALRLAQARDPRIIDRFNDRDDRELTALLACGAGLADLPVDDLVQTAMQLMPEYSVPAAEFAEVLWRASRPTDAAAVMRAILQALPDQPVFAERRRVATAIEAMAALDASRAAEPGTPAWRTAVDACTVLIEDADPRSDGYTRQLAAQIAHRLAARALLTGTEPAPLPDSITGPATTPTVPGDGIPDPAAVLRRRAERLTEAARQLADQAQRNTATAACVRAYAALCVVAAHLLRLDSAELEGDATAAGAHRTAANRRSGLLAAQVNAELDRDDPIGCLLNSALGEVESLGTGSDIAALLARWAELPVPLLLVDGSRSQQTVPAPVDDADADQVPVVVALAHIDGQLVTGPQVLRPGTVYTLRLEIRIGDWPEWAERLDAELITHLRDTEVELPSFTWHKPVPGIDDASTLVGAGSLLLRFGLAAGQAAPPFLVALRFRGDRDGKRLHQQCEVAGHTELRLRPFDASRDGLTQHRVIDERLLQLYERFHGAGYDEDQIQAFCRLLTATCRAALTMSFDTRYRRGRHVTERQFHDDLHQRLHKDPELGGRVERGSRIALGFLDVRHDGITAELKVERKTPVSLTTATKYIGQPTQYAGADGARLSILCILDMSPKAVPIGTLENYLWTLQPALHGLMNPEAPSIVTVLVINGSLPTPSTWSRRRIPTHPIDPGAAHA
jgi:hypothetical protein